MSQALPRGLLLLGVLILGPGCLRPYVPAVHKDRMARLTIEAAHTGTLPGPTVAHRVQVNVHDLRSSCGRLVYEGSIKLTAGATPRTVVPANELVALMGDWYEGGLFGSYSCDAGRLFFPEHGKSYVFVFTGPAKPGRPARRLTCSADIFERINGPGDPNTLAAVPSAFLGGRWVREQELCAVGKEIVKEAATLQQDRARITAEAVAARAFGEAAARAAPTPPPPAGGSSKPR
jgi:hypothetical protein